MCTICFHSEAQELLEKPVEDDTELREEYDKIKNMVEVARTKLSKKARAVGLMKRKLDQIPDRAELTQYQRRFVELSNEGTVLKNCFIFSNVCLVTWCFLFSICQTSRDKASLCSLQHTYRCGNVFE